MSSLPTTDTWWIQPDWAAFMAGVAIGLISIAIVAGLGLVASTPWWRAAIPRLNSALALVSASVPLQSRCAWMKPRSWRR
jgi:hypothetical protein